MYYFDEEDFEEYISNRRLNTALFMENESIPHAKDFEEKETESEEDVIEILRQDLIDGMLGG